MITEKIFDGLFGIVTLILALLPDLSYSIPDGIFTSLSDAVAGVGYVLPVAGLLPILYLSVSQTVFKVVLAVLVRIKSFIPLMGGA